MDGVGIVHLEIISFFAFCVTWKWREQHFLALLELLDEGNHNCLLLLPNLPCWRYELCCLSIWLQWTTFLSQRSSAGDGHRHS